MSSELARNDCWQGRHDDPDNSGLCIYCGVILDAEPDEDPNSFRRSMGWIDMVNPHEPRALVLTEQERDTLVLILRDWLDHDNMNHSDPGQQAAVAILQRLGVEYERAVIARKTGEQK